MFLYNKIRFIGLIFRNVRKTGNNFSLKVFLTYLKLLFKLIFFVNLLHQKIGKEKIFGKPIYFFDYGILVALFEEIFIEQNYFFNSSIKSPKVLDIGSNIGLSILYFKILYPRSQIIAFEPDPKTFDNLQRTIKDSNLKKVTAYNVAISNKTGKSSFYVDYLNPGALIMSLKKERLPKDEIIVETQTLSKYMRGKVELIKMDVEGAEIEIMDYLGKNKLFSNVKQIIMEYHHHINLDEDVFAKTLMVLEKANFGYQIVAKLRSPITETLFQDIVVYAKKKTK